MKERRVKHNEVRSARIHPLLQFRLATEETWRMCWQFLVVSPCLPPSARSSESNFHGADGFKRVLCQRLDPAPGRCQTQHPGVALRRNSSSRGTAVVWRLSEEAHGRGLQFSVGRPLSTPTYSRNLSMRLSEPLLGRGYVSASLHSYSLYLSACILAGSSNCLH